LHWIKKFWMLGPVKYKVVFAACLLAIVPIVIMGTTSYLLAKFSLFEEIGKANRETTKQVQERIDDKLINLDKVALQHAFNPIFKEFLSLPDPYKDVKRFSDVMVVLTSMEVLIPDIDAVYLYKTDQNLIVNPSKGIVTADNLHSSILEAIASNKDSILWIDRKRSEPNVPRGGSHVVTYIRKLPVTKDKPLGYLIIEVNDRAFFDIFSHTQFGTSGEMLIMTASGNVLSDWNKSLLNTNQDDPLIKRFANTEIPEEMATVKVNGKDVLVNYLISDYNGWRYISAVPFDDITASIRWIKHTTLAISILLVMICIGAAISVSGSFFRLLQEVMDIIRKPSNTSASLTKTRNEFMMLRHYMDYLHSSNDHLAEQLKDSLPLLRANFLQRLVTSSVPADELEQKVIYYDLKLPHTHYTVMVAELDNIRGHTVRDAQLFAYGSMNIIRELIVRHGIGVVFQMQDDRIVIILNHGSYEQTQHELQAVAFELADEACTIIQNVLHITVTIGIGYYCNSLNEINHSYREAVEALQYQMIHGSGKAIYIGSMAANESAYFYPIELEQLILTNLKLGQLELLCRHVQEFSTRLTGDKGNGSYEHVHQAFVQLLASTLKTLFELDPEGGPKLFRENLYQKLGSFKTNEAIVKWLTGEIYPSLLDHINQRRAQKQRTTIDTAITYIHEHFSEELSQPFLADLVSMPASQFSSLFKQETGMTLTDYIIAYRMEQAKCWLKDSDMKITEIANKLCYNNPQNFIRVFKRISGMTPGEYRNSVRQQI